MNKTILWAWKGPVELQSSLYQDKWENYVPSGPGMSIIMTFRNRQNAS